MLILGLLGMYFDAAVVFVTIQTLLFRLSLAILCPISCQKLFFLPSNEDFFFKSFCTHKLET